MTRFVLNLTKVKELAFASDYLSVQSDLSTLISCEERGREFIRHQENNYGIEVTDRDLVLKVFIKRKLLSLNGRFLWFFKTISNVSNNMFSEGA